MTINETLTFARTLMDINGLNDWKVLSNKSITTFGSCNFTKKTIKLSGILLPYCSFLAIREIIIHELTHAVVGVEHDHDKVWRKKNIQMGGNGKRMGDESFFETATYDIIKQNHYKYKATCPNGHVHYRNRKPIVAVSCKICDQQFNNEFLLTYH